MNAFKKLTSVFVAGAILATPVPASAADQGTVDKAIGLLKQIVNEAPNTPCFKAFHKNVHTEYFLRFGHILPVSRQTLESDWKWDEADRRQRIKEASAEHGNHDPMTPNQETAFAEWHAKAVAAATKRIEQCGYVKD